MAARQRAGLIFHRSREFRMIRIVFLLTIALGLAGCDTMAGAGQDIATAGHTLTSTAKQTQANMD
ncbi:hypothetical protein GCM10008024_24660 [Allgaiera indica]|uniref:Entericidin n=2 Tax=Allgaiera indica TaxID=765699 RepID=A0AAN4USG8_9RHOB|nr:hypothetical protein GCM10008024_24660 [Allgaiera indica]